MIENTSSVILAVNWCCFLTDPAKNEDSIPFNIIMQMFSPITNEIANGQNGFTSSTTLETDSDYCYQSECCSRRSEIPTREKESESEISHTTDNPVAYSAESEVQSRNDSEETVDKETDLELTLIRHYGEPDYSVFKVNDKIFDIAVDMTESSLPFIR